MSDPIFLKKKEKSKNCKLSSAATRLLFKSNRLNSFIPESLKWSFPSLNLGTCIVANRGFSQKSIRGWQTVQILMRCLITSKGILFRLSG